MPELFDAVLNRQPRIALGVSGPHLGHFFRRIGAECRWRQQTHKSNKSDGADRAQRSSEVATRAKKDRTWSLMLG
jgi:hypothetical protein